MKRIILPTVTLALAVTAASCTSLDEKLITGVSSQYYSTPDGLNSAVIASYAQLRYLSAGAAHVAHAGRHRHLDGRRPGRHQGTMKFIDNYAGNLNSNAGELANTWNPTIS